MKLFNDNLISSEENIFDRKESKYQGENVNKNKKKLSKRCVLKSKVSNSDGNQR